MNSVRKKVSFWSKQQLNIVIFATAVLGLSVAADNLRGSLVLPNIIQDFTTLTLSIFVEALPFVALGAFLATAVNNYVSSERILSILPAAGFWRRAAISTLGFFMPVCECGNVPLSRSLIIQGLKPSEAIAFLLAAPVLNPVTIWSTWAAFNFDPAIVYSRIVGTIVIAWVISYVISLKKNEQDFLTDSFTKTCIAHRKKSTAPSDGSKLQSRTFAKGFSTEAYTMLRMLAFGAIIAGLVQTFIPRDILLDIGSNVVLSIVAMLLLAFVVSICANVDAFFALAFANTFSAGSIVSFLVFGPMIDIKMIALLKTTFTKELMITVSLLALCMSALTGLVVTYAL